MHAVRALDDIEENSMRASSGFDWHYCAMLFTVSAVPCGSTMRAINVKRTRKYGDEAGQTIGLDACGDGFDAVDAGYFSSCKALTS